MVEIDERKLFFRRQRLFQLLNTILIIFLEIIQLITFVGFDPDKTIFDYYFSIEIIQIYGLKFFYHLLLAITLIDILYLYLRFKFRWLSGPYQSDIFNDIALFYLWFVAGLTNVYPIFKKFDIECIGIAFDGQKYGVFLNRVLCEGYCISVMLGWLMIIQFIISSISYLKLWRASKRWDIPINNNNHNGNDVNNQVIDDNYSDIADNRVFDVDK